MRQQIGGIAVDCNRARVLQLLPARAAAKKANERNAGLMRSVSVIFGVADNATFSRPYGSYSV
jgi:hypothetical protein